MFDKIKNSVKDFYEAKKTLVFVMVFAFFIITVSVGVLIGLYGRPKVVPLTPEEENLRAILEMKDDEKKIIQGEMLSTKNNLDFEQLEYSRNYVESLKNKR